MKASVLIAYLLVVIIWSTTPLTLVWSSETIHPSMAALLRMTIGAIIGAVLIIVFRIRFPWHRVARRLYAFSAIGVFGGMSFAYAASKYLPSGIMSLFFGLAPFISGFMGTRLLSEPGFSRIQKIALVVAIAGFAVIMLDNNKQLNLEWQGVVLILLAVFFFCLSAVLVKGVALTINPIATTVGALFYSIPAFALVWYLMDGSLDYVSWSAKSVGSTIYLGIFGSLVGFIAYYFVLQKLLASTVSLITLMTPVLSIVIGAYLNQEAITDNLVYGAAVIILALTGFLFGDRWLQRRRAKLETISSN